MSIIEDTKNNWKAFVVMILKLGACNSTEEITNAINKHSNADITKKQVAAVRANFTRGAYNN